MNSQSTPQMDTVLGTDQEGDDDGGPLSQADFELVASTGIEWITDAYNNDYAVYLLKHAEECDPNWSVLDPFHRGLTAHPWDVEDRIAQTQKHRAAEGKPLFKANTEDPHYFENSFYGLPD